MNLGPRGSDLFIVSLYLSVLPLVRFRNEGASLKCHCHSQQSHQAVGDGGGRIPQKSLRSRKGARSMARDNVMLQPYVSPASCLFWMRSSAWKHPLMIKIAKTVIASWTVLVRSTTALWVSVSGDFCVFSTYGVCARTRAPRRFPILDRFLNRYRAIFIRFQSDKKQKTGLLEIYRMAWIFFDSPHLNICEAQKNENVVVFVGHLRTPPMQGFDFVARTPAQITRRLVRLFCYTYFLRECL